MSEQTETAQAHEYLSRLLMHYAPQCKPLASLDGVCSQIDNLLTGMVPSGALTQIRDEMQGCENAGHRMLKDWADRLSLLLSQQTANKEDTRVDDSQYAAQPDTAASNQPLQRASNSLSSNDLRLAMSERGYYCKACEGWSSHGPTVDCPVCGFKTGVPAMSEQANSLPVKSCIHCRPGRACEYHKPENNAAMSEQPDTARDGQ